MRKAFFPIFIFFMFFSFVKAGEFSEESVESMILDHFVGRAMDQIEILYPLANLQDLGKANFATKLICVNALKKENCNIKPRGLINKIIKKNHEFTVGDLSNAILEAYKMALNAKNADPEITGALYTTLIFLKATIPAFMEKQYGKNIYFPFWKMNVFKSQSHITRIFGSNPTSHLADISYAKKIIREKINLTNIKDIILHSSLDNDYNYKLLHNAYAQFGIAAFSREIYLSFSKDRSKIDSLSQKDVNNIEQEIGDGMNNLAEAQLLYYERVAKYFGFSLAEMRWYNMDFANLILFINQETCSSVGHLKFVLSLKTND